MNNNAPVVDRQSSGLFEANTFRGDIKSLPTQLLKKFIVHTKDWELDQTLEYRLAVGKTRPRVFVMSIDQLRAEVLSRTK